jgi:hypothetical protein
MRRDVLLSVAVATLLACTRNAPPPQPQQEVPIGLAPSPPEVDPSPAEVEGQGVTNLEPTPVPSSLPEDGGPGSPPLIAVAPSALPGGGRAVDPVAFLPFARRTANLGADAQLISVWAHHVSLAGSVDLGTSTAGSSIEYRFKRRASGAPAPGPQPLTPTPIGAEGAGGTTVVADVLVDALGVHAPTTRAERVAAPVPDPRCTTKKLMALAKHAGASTGATASLVYGDTVGSHWELRVEGAGIAIVIREPSCTVDPQAHVSVEIVGQGT